MNVLLVGAFDRQLDELLNSCGFRTAPTPLENLVALARPSVVQPDVIVLDLREQMMLPPAVALLKRHHPLTGVVIIASRLDPALMLEAMRAGVNEFVTEPVTEGDVRAAIDRVASKTPVHEPGQIFAFLGGKGGVGTTTLAVNVAAVLARMEASSTVLIDLHVAYGDAAVFLGAEPRFSVADALENVHRMDEAFLRGLVGRTKLGLELLASSDRAMVGPLDVRAVRSLIECAARRYRHVILDVPASDAAMLDALELVTKIVVVANQELATVRSASRMAAMLRHRYGKDRVIVVVNRYDQLAEIGRKDIERVMGGPVKHMFPSNYRLALEALSQGRPLVLDNHNKLANSFESFARGLVARVDAETSTRERPPGLLGRFSLRA